MTARRNTAGRIIGNRKVVGAALAITTATLLLATEVPQGLSKAVGGSAALAELAARSPGARIGGVALKAKSRRSALSPVADSAVPASEGPTSAVLSTPADSKSPVPLAGPAGPGSVPNDVFAAAVPDQIGTVEGSPTGAGPAIDFGSTTLPQVGGLPIFVGGGPSGGGGGGGSPGVGPGPGNTVVPPVPPGPGVGAIPEPSTWLMLISGFGVTGGAMRRRRRVRFA